MDQMESRRRLYLRLHLAEGVGAMIFRRLVDHFGGVEEACQATASRLRQVEGVGEKTAAAIAGVEEAAVEEELALAERHGAGVLCLEDAAYPAGLKKIPDPPPVLYVLGELAGADAVALAVVGSRRCTQYGLEQAERLGGLLGRAGFTVVSGGARGIDAAAQRGCLEAGGRTIAVMGCGLCTLYPPENAPLFKKIAADGRGAVISELPMRTAVLAGNFPNRNRIISGLSLGVLVVEAARRSGSLITAGLAIEQGKEVFAVPGRVDSPFSQGTNRLIATGQAHLVGGLDDVLDALGEVGVALKGQGTSEVAPPTGPQLTGAEQVLLSHLIGAELSLDELVRRSGLPSGQVTATMTMLAIKGAVVQRPGGIFAVRSRPPAH
jgi:DNA processing protein